MRQQTSLAQHKFAHALQVMQSRFIAEMAQCVSHLGKQQFRLIAEAEESFGTSQLFAGAGDGQHFLRSQGMRSGFSGIAAESAVTAVVAAEIRQRQENLPRVGDDTGFEVFFCGARRPDQRWKISVTAAYQPQGQFARDGRTGAQIVQFRRTR